jgi:Rha family phage regulatory protein
MDYLIKPNGEGLFAEKKNGQAMIDSRTVAEVFEKEHKNVMQSIEKLKADAVKTAVNSENQSAENSADYNKDINAMFVQSVYKDAMGRKQKCYNMTRDGFSLLIMGFTGAKALEWKLKYIKAFNNMESHIRQFYAYREEYPEYTDAIKEHYEREGKTSRFAYSNEADMINRIVLGMTAKEFKKANEIDEHVNSIRPYLEKKQIHMIHMLQSIDIAYLDDDIPYKERKEKLEAYAIRKGWNIGAKMIVEVGE